MRVGFESDANMRCYKRALGPVYTYDCSSLRRLFCDKMGIEPNWKIYCKLDICSHQAPIKAKAAFIEMR